MYIIIIKTNDVSTLNFFNPLNNSSNFFSIIGLVSILKRCAYLSEEFGSVILAHFGTSSVLLEIYEKIQ